MATRTRLVGIAALSLMFASPAWAWQGEGDTGSGGSAYGQSGKPASGDQGGNNNFSTPDGYTYGAQRPDGTIAGDTHDANDKSHGFNSKGTKN